MHLELHKAYNALYKGMAFVLIFQPVSEATTLIALITPQGIVLGADSKIKNVKVGNGMALEEPTGDKAFLVAGRFCIAAIGAERYNVLTFRFKTINFEVGSVIATAGKRISKKDTLNDLVSAIETETLRQWSGIEDVIAYDAIHFHEGQSLQSLFPDNRTVEFLIGGYEANVPVVISLHFDIDWQTKTFASSRERLPPFPPVLRGFQRVIHDFYKPGTTAYRTIQPLAPREVAMLANGKAPRIAATVGLVRILLRAESGNGTDMVLPPFVVVAVPHRGKGKVVRYSD